MHRHPPPVALRPEGRLSTRYRHTSRHRLLPHRQRGAIALFMTVIILLAVTLTVIFTARTASMEQRMSANEVRAKQAANAAQAGLERAVAYVQGGGTDVTQLFSANFATDGMTYRARLWDPDPDAAPPQCPENPAAMGTNNPDSTRSTLIYSCGWSDDLSARKVVTMLVQAGPSVGYPPTNPLISKGSVDTNGRARVFNLFNNLTIWTGGVLDVTGNPGNTFVRNPDFPRPDISDPLPNEPANCGVHTAYVCTTDANVTGPDMIHSDLSLSSLTSDEFFENFMGLSKADYRNTVATVKQPNDDLSNVGGQVIWIDGNPSVSIGGQIGTRTNPVILVINGDANTSGNTVLYGIFYVTGDLTVTGTPKFYGSSIIEGEVDKAGGTPYFIFDPLAAGGASELGQRSTVPGTWRDWL